MKTSDQWNNRETGHIFLPDSLVVAIQDDARAELIQRENSCQIAFALSQSRAIESDDALVGLYRKLTLNAPEFGRAAKDWPEGSHKRDELNGVCRAYTEIIEFLQEHAPEHLKGQLQ